MAEPPEETPPKAPRARSLDPGLAMGVAGAIALALALVIGVYAFVLIDG